MAMQRQYRASRAAIWNERRPRGHGNLADGRQGLLLTAQTRRLLREEEGVELFQPETEASWLLFLAFQSSYLANVEGQAVAFSLLAAKVNEGVEEKTDTDDDVDNDHDEEDTVSSERVTVLFSAGPATSASAAAPLALRTIMNGQVLRGHRRTGGVF